MFKYTLHNPVCQYGFETIEIEATNAVDLQEQIVTALELLQVLNTRQVYTEGRLGDANRPSVNPTGKPIVAERLAVNNVVAGAIGGLPAIPGQFTYKIPYQQKDLTNPILKQHRAKWNPNSKVWESPVRIAQLESYLIGPVVVRQIQEPLKTAFNYEE